MTKGVARRYRGFFASRADELTVRTTDAASMVSTAVLPDTAERRENLVIDRDGARLTEVAALPWQTIVVREDGFGSLGDGIAVLKEGASDVAVTNRTGRALRGALIWLPGTRDARYLGRIDDGTRVLASSGMDIAASSDGRYWYSQVLSTLRAGGVDIYPLKAEYMSAFLEKDAPGLADAWAALEDAADTMTSWFPEGVPVLLAQLDGGEGRTSDSGLRLESDRLLLRIVGYGGKP
jgi:hypothetical protein